MSLLRNFISILILNLIPAGVIFTLAGRWDLWNVWAYLGLHATLLSLNALAVYLKSPDLFKERVRPAAHGRAGWTGYPSLVVFLLLQWIIAGLDLRYHWSDLVSLVGILSGLALSTIGWGLITWATLINPFFSSAIRIQADRGQQVISEGPYAIVRHPGYFGPLVDGAGGGLALNSLLALIPILLILLPVTIYRTLVEDRMLLDELSGYGDYAAKVRHRLIPGVW